MRVKSGFVAYFLQFRRKGGRSKYFDYWFYIMVISKKSETRISCGFYLVWREGWGFARVSLFTNVRDEGVWRWGFSWGRVPSGKTLIDIPILDRILDHDSTNPQIHSWYSDGRLDIFFLLQLVYTTLYGFDTLPTATKKIRTHMCACFSCNSYITNFVNYKIRTLQILRKKKSCITKIVNPKIRTLQI